jgi:hypothetical protein
MITAEVDGARVEVFRSYRCGENPRNGHFEFRFLETVPESYACFGFVAGDNSWDCCRTGKFKNWRREQEGVGGT